jgi:hypothetical protein
MLLLVEDQCLGTLREETYVWLEILVDVATKNNELADRPCKWIEI